MGLLQNNYRDFFGSVRFFNAGVGQDGANAYTQSYSNKMPGAQRNIFASDAGVSSLSSKPTGARHPVAWQMPQKAGGLGSRNATKIEFNGDDSLAVRGLPGSGSSTITFTPTATGGLIVSGSGSASITFDATGTILSIAAGSGSATISLSGSALIGALAGIAGTGTITLSPTATIAAIGYLAGLSTNEAEFSPDALARAVWDALKVDYNEAGTMGELMNNLGSGGLSPADFERIADTILRRSTANVEASAHGDAISLRSLYGMVAQGVHKTSIAGSTLTVTKSDDSTTLGTRTVETSSTAEPIVSLDTD